MRSRMTRRHRHCVQARRLLFTYTMATIQPSFANAAKFFNSLLVLLPANFLAGCTLWLALRHGGG